MKFVVTIRKRYWEDSSKSASVLSLSVSLLSTVHQEPTESRLEHRNRAVRVLDFCIIGGKVCHRSPCECGFIIRNLYGIHAC